MKKFMAIVMTLAMVISMMTVVSFAAGDITFGITTVEVEAGTTEATVALYVSNNPGITACAFEITYDKNISLTKKATYTGIFEEGSATTGSKIDVQPYKVNWSQDSDDFYQTGDIFEFTFAIPADAKPGTEYEINLNTDEFSTYNAMFDEYEFDLIPGKIKIKAAAPEYEDGFYNLTAADNKASVSYFGTVEAATLYVATYNKVGTGLELVSVKTVDIAADTVEELTNVEAEADVAGEVVKAFLWDADMNPVAVGTLAE